MSRDSAVIRPASLADIQHFYGNPPITMRAWAIEYGGALAGLAGYSLGPSSATVWMRMDPGIKAPPAAVVKASLRVVEAMRATGMTLTAFRDASDSSVSNSSKFLRKMGFSLIGRENGLEVWEQRPRMRQ